MQFFLPCFPSQDDICAFGNLLKREIGRLFVNFQDIASVPVVVTPSKPTNEEDQIKEVKAVHEKIAPDYMSTIIHASEHSDKESIFV